VLGLELGAAGSLAVASRAGRRRERLALLGGSRESGGGTSERGEAADQLGRDSGRERRQSTGPGRSGLGASNSGDEKRGNKLSSVGRKDSCGKLAG
jgi:hypothetical protein